MRGDAAATQTERPEVIEQSESTLRAPTLLGDKDVMQFLAQGFLALPVNDLPDGLQQQLFEEAVRNTPEMGGRGGGWLSNNCLPMLPKLRDVFTSSVVHGALVSLLGEDYSINNHRHMHHSSINSEQSMHKDEQRWPAEHHRLRSVIIFYVPGGCSLEMGPTAIVPGAHLLSRDCGDWGELAGEIKESGTATTLAPTLREIKLTAPKGVGTAVLLHHSMFHRGTARLVDDETGEPIDENVRPMFKFIFTRCREPTAPDWNSQGAPAESMDWRSLVSEPAMAPALQSLWEWQVGVGNAPLASESVEIGITSESERAVAVATLLAPSVPGDDAERTGAAYRLARSARCGDMESLATLTQALAQRESPAGRRCAAHALTSAPAAAAAPVGGPLLRLFEDGTAAGDWELAVNAADAIGECGYSGMADDTLSLIDWLSSTAIDLHHDFVLQGEASWITHALPPLHNRWAVGPDAVVGSLVLALDHLAMAVAGRAGTGSELWALASTKVCETALFFLGKDGDYQHPFTHARAPVLAAEALGNLALHDVSRSLPASLLARVVAQLQVTVADSGTSARLYAPVLECLRRIVVCGSAEHSDSRRGAGMRAARRVMLSTWGLVDQQNNRGW
jgi:hypothetical protein